MAEIPPHVSDVPQADYLGPDPEPIGTRRFELLLAHAAKPTPPKRQTRPVMTSRSTGRAVQRPRRPAHVGAR